MKQKLTKKENRMYKTPDENTDMKQRKGERQRRNEHNEKTGKGRNKLVVKIKHVRKNEGMKERMNEKKKEKKN